MIGFVIVFAIIALIWWGGSTIRGCFADAPPSADAGGDAEPEAAASASATPSATPSASVAAPAVDAAIVDAGPPRSVTCQALHDATDKAFAAAKAQWSCFTPPDVDSLGCATLTKGTWGFRAETARLIAPPSGTDACGEFGALVDLVHVDSSGNEVAEIPNLFLFQRDDASADAGYFKYDHSTGAFGITLAEARVFDWDGDGEGEVYVKTRIGTKDFEQQSEAAVVTFAGGKVVPYKGSADLAIDGIDDVDGDGRPDLILHTWKAQIENDKGLHRPATSVRGIAHSLADGTFSTKDAAAVAYLQKQCPSAPNLDGLAGGTLMDGDVVACALLWSVPAAKLEPLVAKAPPWARALSKEKPPLVLR